MHLIILIIFLLIQNFNLQSYDKFEKIDINSDLIGALASYFGEHARLKCNPSKDILS